MTINRIVVYVENYLQRHGHFPTIRRAARSLGCRQGDLELLADEGEELMLTTWPGDWPLGDWMIEVF